MKVGNRIYYNELTGKIIFQTGQMEGDVIAREKEMVKYIDLEYGNKTLEGALTYHIENGKLIVDKYIKKTETETEKLAREKSELENQLLLQTDNNIEGGLL